MRKGPFPVDAAHHPRHRHRFGRGGRRVPRDVPGSYGKVCAVWANEKKKTAGASSPDPEKRAEAASAGARSEEGTGDFPAAPFDAEGGVAPLREEDRDEVTGVPFRRRRRVSTTTPTPTEFDDDADSILDDDQRDYYRYGEKMHGVHKTAADLRKTKRPPAAPNV